MANSFLSRRYKKVSEIPFVDSALEKAKQHGQQFWVTLNLQARLLAYRENAERVLVRHVDEAASIILSPKIKSGWKEKLTKFIQEFLKIIGGTLVGGFISGVVNTLSTVEAKLSLLELNAGIVAMGFIGLIMIFIGLSMESWRS